MVINNSKRKHIDLYLNIGLFYLKISQKINKHSIKAVKYWNDKIKEKFHGFLTERAKKVDAVIELTSNNLSFLKERNTDKYYLEIFKKTNSFKYITYNYISHSQLFCLLAFLMEELIKKRGGFFLHASANKISENESLLFIGSSGDGKSTISNLLNYKYPKIADDISMIYKFENDYYLFPTPIDEKIKINKNNIKLYKIKSIFLIKKSKEIKLNKFNNIKYLNKKIHSLIRKIDFVNYNDKNYKKHDLFLSNQLDDFIINKKNDFFKLSFPFDKQKTLIFFHNFIKK